MSDKDPVSGAGAPPRAGRGGDGVFSAFLGFFIEQKLVVLILTALLIGWGIASAPFDWRLQWLPRNPVPVDAIPNLGENQQIVFTEWAGRSPRDMEDQVTYPLTVSLLGIPGVREVRSLSMFGFSSIYVIFGDEIEFYWSRSRILEKLNSLPAGILPEGVQPTLGPDATGLGQIFWYTLEGRDPEGRTTGGWDLQELRSIQDWYVRFGLQSAEGISEVASIGGHVSEYHVDVDPDALRVFSVSLEEVADAVRKSNLDVGARATEINRIEYLIRGAGFIRQLSDIEQAVVRMGERNVPIRVSDVATVSRGPAERLGALTVQGAEAVGGVVVVREGYNPLQALNHVRAKLEELRPGLPAKAVVHWDRVTPAKADAFALEEGLAPFGSDGAPEAWLAWLRSHPQGEWPDWLTLSAVSIVPFYDRTGLIYETLGTLNDALIQQVLVTILVVLAMVLHLRAALVISLMLPLAILTAFIGMKVAGVAANIVALAGIAIAIGTIVDMGVIITENVLRHLREAAPEEPRSRVVLRGTSEVGSAVLTAISTTVISFLPVFTMTGPEGKMFVPLAYTKTFVLVASILIALTIIPAALDFFIARRWSAPRLQSRMRLGLLFVSAALFAIALANGWLLLAAVALIAGLITLLRYALDRVPRAQEGPGRAPAVARAGDWARRHGNIIAVIAAILAVAWTLAIVWEPLGPERGFLRNFLFIALLAGGLLGAFFLFARLYERILRWALQHKGLFLLIPGGVVLFGLTVWLGFGAVFRFGPAGLERAGLPSRWLTESRPWVWAAHEFPGLGREFLPALGEGAFLWMPTTMPHASIGEALDVVRYQDQAIASIPEIENVVGKIGRAETALDPAPISMLETVIQYKPEYATDRGGRRLRFRFDAARGEFVRDSTGELIPDTRGRPYRQWRDHIRSPDDIWTEIVAAAQLPGTTSAPKLQPIETRLVMLQTGMRAPMGLKLRGPDLETLDGMALEIEALLRQVPQLSPETVAADRVVGKPYLEVHFDRSAVSRFGLNIADVQQVIAMAIGGTTVTTTVEGRERYPVRVRYPRERRNLIEDLERVLIAAPGGAHIPLRQLAEVRYVRGPQMIRSEDTFLTAYVTFDRQPGVPEVNAVEAAAAYLDAMVRSGELAVPAGVSWRFAGTYEHQQRAAQTLAVVLPIALMIIFLILYFQFRSVPLTLIVFSSILVAWGGGFTMLYWYGQEWFANFSVLGVNMRELFQLHPIHLSVAVWVGFLALFGIAVDDGVVMTTYLRQSLPPGETRSVAAVREAVVAGALRRLRPCLMTTATTILALLPVLTSTGRGAEVMIPMALPSVGGMAFVLLSLFTVPILYAWLHEPRMRRGGN